MSVIAEFSVPAQEFVLGNLLEVRSGVQVRLETMIPMGDTLIPYFWVKSPDVEAVGEALRGTKFVEDVRVLDQVGDETLFRVTWADDVNGLIESLTESRAAVLDGTGHGDHWSFQVRFPEYDTLSRFYRSVVDKGISLDLTRIHDPIRATSGSQFGLTDEQREVLLLALEEGYFDVPRGATLVELSDRLDISDSAVSQRLRRGLTKVLSATLDTAR